VSVFQFLVTRQVFALIGPAVLVIFALTFLLIWLLDRTRLHILFFSAAFFIYSLAVTAQILFLPGDIGLNSLLSALLYVTGALCLVEGLLRRASRQVSKIYYAVAVLAIMAGISYVHYVNDDLVARIYVLNFGMALIFLTALTRLGSMKRGMLTDRILYWSFGLFAVHFLPRTLLTINTYTSLESFATSAFWVPLQIIMPLFGVVLGLALLATSAADTIKDLQYEKDTDPLTGLLNRRGFEVLARPMIDERSHDRRSLSVIVCDVDHFKTINDTYGHGGGDNVLRAIATILREAVPNSDIVARIGGEEFVILLRGVDAEGARAFAEELRETFETTRFAAAAPSWSVTASFGIAEHRESETVWDLVSRADRALYAAKNAGRNQSLIDGFDPIRTSPGDPSPENPAAFVANRAIRRL
jgi:diguanylate cyclase (GGDEF)-like protein